MEFIPPREEVSRGRELSLASTALRLALAIPSPRADKHRRHPRKLAGAGCLPTQAFGLLEPPARHNQSEYHHQIEVLALKDHPAHRLPQAHPDALNDCLRSAVQGRSNRTLNQVAKTAFAPSRAPPPATMAAVPTSLPSSCEDSRRARYELAPSFAPTPDRRANCGGRVALAGTRTGTTSFGPFSATSRTDSASSQTDSGA